LEMLDLLEAVLKFGEVLVASSTLKSENIDRFRRLVSSIQGIRQVWGGKAVTKPSSVEDMAEMYRLAALVYLRRTMERFLGPSQSVIGEVECAFAILAKLRVCERAFPLSILGCEAQTDERRNMILALISKTQERGNIRSYACVKRLVTTFWNLKDLDTKDEIPYSKKMSSVITNSDFLPTFT